MLLIKFHIKKKYNQHYLCNQVAQVSGMANTAFTILVFNTLGSCSLVAFSWSLYLALPSSVDHICLCKSVYLTSYFILLKFQMLSTEVTNNSTK